MLISPECTTLFPPPGTEYGNRICHCRKIALIFLPLFLNHKGQCWVNWLIFLLVTNRIMEQLWLNVISKLLNARSSVPTIAMNRTMDHQDHEDHELPRVVVARLQVKGSAERKPAATPPANKIWPGRFTANLKSAILLLRWRAAQGWHKD